MSDLYDSAMSDYQTIAIINEPHQIYLVQHQETHKIYIKKVLNIYNLNIYQYLEHAKPQGTPQVIECQEKNNELIIIEEYISGSTLQEKLETGDLTISSITHYMNELCNILKELHSAEPPIVHRDIKPSNIMITHFDHVILLDFNAAKYYTESSSSDTVLLGTRGYAAPEQYGFGSSSPLTDIYAAGVLLKELSSVLPDIPASFLNVIQKCTEINPADRFQSVSELSNALMQTPVGSKSTAQSQSILPPGFRTKTPWKVLVSSIVYSVIFWLCLSLDIKNKYGAGLWVERIFCLFMMLSVIFVSFDYMNLQALFPLCRCKNIFLRYVGVTIYIFLLILAFFIIMFLIESIFSL